MPNKAVVVSPKRTSLPSVLPTVEWMPAAATAGLFWCSAADVKPTHTPNRITITDNNATPWRTLPTILPKV